MLQNLNLIIVAAKKALSYSDSCRSGCPRYPAGTRLCRGNKKTEQRLTTRVKAGPIHEMIVSHVGDEWRPLEDPITPGELVNSSHYFILKQNEQTARNKTANEKKFDFTHIFSSSF